jgi:hypothetical protein
MCCICKCRNIYTSQLCSNTCSCQSHAVLFVSKFAAQTHTLSGLKLELLTNLATQRNNNNSAPTAAANSSLKAVRSAQQQHMRGLLLLLLLLGATASSAHVSDGVPARLSLMLLLRWLAHSSPLSAAVCY